jgi:hypothetical protein
MSETRRASGRGGTGNRTPRWVKYVFWGGAAGLVVGVCGLFVAAVFHGEAMGLSPGACAAFACVLTLLLSQPAALVGVLAGAAVGAAAGGVVYGVRHGRRAV